MIVEQEDEHGEETEPKRIFWWLQSEAVALVEWNKEEDKVQFDKEELQLDLSTWDTDWWRDTNIMRTILSIWRVKIFS